MPYTQEFICPSCSGEIELPTERWDTKHKCPQCGAALMVDYDFTVLDDGEEWDHYTLILNTETKF